jgi:hypothetical protein
MTGHLYGALHMGFVGPGRNDKGPTNRTTTMEELRIGYVCKGVREKRGCVDKNDFVKRVAPFKFDFVKRVAPFKYLVEIPIPSPVT